MELTNVVIDGQRLEAAKCSQCGTRIYPAEKMVEHENWHRRKYEYLQSDMGYMRRWRRLDFLSDDTRVRESKKKRVSYRAKIAV